MLVASLAGCTTGTSHGDAGDGGDGVFVSDNPSAADALGQPAATFTTTGGSDGAGGGTPDPAGDAESAASRAIAEADILQVDGEKLYALSRYSGLSIIDIGHEDHLTILGRWQAPGTPLEMILRDGVIYAMFDEAGHFVQDDPSGKERWVTTSRVEALDVGNPAAIAEVGSFDLPGTIADSRAVGDVLYTVTYEDGTCWGCKQKPNTTITALAVGDPKKVRVVDQLTYEASDEDTHGLHRKSLFVDQSRMFLAGIEWSAPDEGHSTIQVVDISDPTGKLVEGAHVKAAGLIESRWQMDAHDGVLRVVSQPGFGPDDGTPIVQTFTIESSFDLQPLGSLALTLPKPERLRAVRFDGDRAYAIAADQDDPLVTIDLSVPSTPKQAGSIELPGFVYHMAPRGDRLYAIGFEEGNPDGSLHVSLFDVADLEKPALMERIHFGGDLSFLGEQDQDRIHKALAFVDDLGLLLVPFRVDPAEYESRTGECASYPSGIQLVDIGGDTLVKRGVAPQKGWARRAFLHGDRLFGVSNSDVTVFDIADRDAPKTTVSTPFTAKVGQSVVVGGNVVRLASDWESGSARLDVVPLADPATSDPIGSLDYSVLDPTGACWAWGGWTNDLFANGSTVTLVRSGWKKGGGGRTTSVDVIDLSDPAKPTPVGHVDLDFNAYATDDPWGCYGDASAGANVVQVGSTLVFRDVAERVCFDPKAPKSAQQVGLEIVDLANPKSPVHTRVELPSGFGHTKLLVDGHDVLLSRWVPDDAAPLKVRFHVDRVDVSHPSSPVIAAPLNVPGAVVAVDGPSGRLTTLDYELVSVDGMVRDECWAAYGYSGRFVPAAGLDPYGSSTIGTCLVMRRAFRLCDVAGGKAKLLAQAPLPAGTYVGVLLAGDDRVFGVHSPTYGHDYTDAEADAEYTLRAAPAGSDTPTLFALGGMRDGQLVQVSHEVADDDAVFPAAVIGAKAVTLGHRSPAIGLFDTTSLDAPTLGVVHGLAGRVSSLSVQGETAVCSMGAWGVTTVDLSGK